MAIVFRARYQPEVNRSRLESLTAGLDPVKGNGLLVLTAQLVAYDDSRYDPNVAVPGKPDDEARLIVIEEAPVSVDLEGLSGQTPAQVQATLAQILDNWSASLQGIAPILLKVRRAAQLIGMRPLPMV